MNFLRLAALTFILAATILTAAEPADILPDPSFKGWTRVPIPATDGVKDKLQWRVDAANHTLICTGDGQHEWLRYDTPLSDFILEVDFRFTPKGDVKYNSGIGVRMSKSADLWVQAQTGPTGGFLFGENLVDGAVQRFHLMKDMKENRIKPAGEWNHYEIRAQGDRVTLLVNGAAVSEVRNLALRRGFIGLEGEFFEITFKNLKLTQLADSATAMK